MTSWSTTRRTGRPETRRWHLGSLTVRADALGYISGHGLVLPLIALDGPS